SWQDPQEGRLAAVHRELRHQGAEIGDHPECTLPAILVLLLLTDRRTPLRRRLPIPRQRQLTHTIHVDPVVVDVQRGREITNHLGADTVPDEEVTSALVTDEPRRAVTDVDLMREPRPGVVQAL